LQDDFRLTPTSYIVLGLLHDMGDGTPYDLKQRLALSVANFWPVPHAQLYREPDRLAAAGYVSERREEGGRRRRFYAITERGIAALRAWLDEAPSQPPELRDAGVLKLFFGADPAAVAERQRPLHEAKLAEYEGLHEQLTESGAPAGWLRALEAGMAYERSAIERWSALTSARPS
jgi:PadR family transcriptional regulator, regulatory protein AphA